MSSNTRMAKPELKARIANGPDTLTDPPTEIVLFAEGYTGIGATDDATPPFDEEQARSIIAHFKIGGNPIPIDYHHATESESPDKRAVAAGWIHGLEWRDGVGLVATDVEWTKRAAELIREKEYRFYSPAWLAKTETNEAVRLTSVALTNTPLTKRQTELLKQAAEETMAKKTKKKSAALKLHVAAEVGKDVRDKVRKSAEEVLPDVDVSVETLPDEEVQELDEVGEMLRALAEALDMDPEMEATAIIAAAIDALKGATEPEEETPSDDAPSEAEKKEVAELRLKAAETGALRTQLSQFRKRLAAIEAEREDSRVKALVDEQIAQGKILPTDETQMKVAEDLARRDEETFTKYFASIQPIVEPGTTTGPNGAAVSSRRREIIQTAKREYADNEFLKRGSILRTYINTSLRLAEQPSITDEEAKALGVEAN